ncbi:hypothetical protein SETIT_8G223800v2 [Setaria italica]|uniref:Uncharacterized protein n=1 Tax=Setaria italica TaxID=4555 RepID=A0A368SAN7_SETIT|nr:hypothetical protein SETIT_8G223800v2 [Setaria italica]
MARIVHYLMPTSFVVLVMISFNSSSCQACFFPWCRPPCFKVLDRDCTDLICAYVCRFEGFNTLHAYCKKPRNTKKPQVYLCCCPAKI